MNALSVFEFQESHPVRVQVIEGEPWFCLKDVCEVLTIANPRRVAAEILDEKGVRKTDTLTNGGQQQIAFINEPNLYRVIFRSNKRQARQFQDWVFNEVLPAIRRTGGYGYVEPASKCAAEPLDWRVEHELRAIVNDIAQCFWYKQKWMNGIRHALRNACRTPAPLPLTVDDLPAIVAELRRILTAVETAQGNMRAYERDFLRDVVRRGHRNASGVDLLPVDLDMAQEKVLPAHFELAIEKLEALSAKISHPACCR